MEFARDRGLSDATVTRRVMSSKHEPLLVPAKELHCRLIGSMHVLVVAVVQETSEFSQVVGSLGGLVCQALVGGKQFLARNVPLVLDPCVLIRIACDWGEVLLDELLLNGRQATLQKALADRNDFLGEVGHHPKQAA